MYHTSVCVDRSWTHFVVGDGGWFVGVVTLDDGVVLGGGAILWADIRGRDIAGGQGVQMGHLWENLLYNSQDLYRSL